jgi:hypothetical protein
MGGFKAQGGIGIFFIADTNVYPSAEPRHHRSRFFLAPEFFPVIEVYAGGDAFSPCCLQGNFGKFGGTVTQGRRNAGRMKPSASLGWSSQILNLCFCDRCPVGHKSPVKAHAGSGFQEINAQAVTAFDNKLGIAKTAKVIDGGLTDGIVRDLVTNTPCKP